MWVNGIKPAYEQISFTEYVATITDSALLSVQLRVNWVFTNPAFWHSSWTPNKNKTYKPPEQKYPIFGQEMFNPWDKF